MFFFDFFSILYSFILFYFILFFFYLFFIFFFFFREWFWNKDIDPEGSYKHVLFRLAEPLLSSDSHAQVSFFFSFCYRN